MWAATVLINTMIMTVYLWHITVMIIFVAILYLLDGVGLGLEPGTQAWWFSRPVWILILIVLLTPVALLGTIKQVDEVIIFYAPKILGDGLPALNNLGISGLDECIHLRNVRHRLVGPDFMVTGRPE